MVVSEEVENGVGGLSDGHLPDWAGMVEEVQYNIVTLREKTKRVAALQSNLVRRPSLDDNAEEERQLTAHNNEIRRVSYSDYVKFLIYFFIIYFLVCNEV